MRASLIRSPVLKENDVATGQAEHRFDISAISLGAECEVTTSTDHDFSTNDFVRLMNLDIRTKDTRDEPTKVQMAPLDGEKYRVIVTDTDKFKIQDPTTFEYIDTTDYQAYVSGGNVNLVENSFDYEA